MTDARGMGKRRRGKRSLGEPQGRHGAPDGSETIRERVNPINDTHDRAAGHGPEIHSIVGATEGDWRVRRCITLTPL